MPYKVNYMPRFGRDMKALKKNKQAVREVKEQVLAVLESPEIGEPYTRNLSGLYKVAFGEHPQYRLIYRIYPCCRTWSNADECPAEEEETFDGTGCEGIISFIFIRTREECNNLYKKDKAYFDQTIQNDFTPPA